MATNHMVLQCGVEDSTTSSASYAFQYGLRSFETCHSFDPSKPYAHGSNANPISFADEKFEYREESVPDVRSDRETGVFSGAYSVGDSTASFLVGKEYTFVQMKKLGTLQYDPNSLSEQEEPTLPITSMDAQGEEYDMTSPYMRIRKEKEEDEGASPSDPLLIFSRNDPQTGECKKMCFPDGGLRGVAYLTQNAIQYEMLAIDTGTIACLNKVGPETGTILFFCMSTACRYMDNGMIRDTDNGLYDMLSAGRKVARRYFECMSSYKRIRPLIPSESILKGKARKQILETGLSSLIHLHQADVFEKPAYCDCVFKKARTFTEAYLIWRLLDEDTEASPFQILNVNTAEEASSLTGKQVTTCTMLWNKVTGAQHGILLAMLSCCDTLINQGDDDFKVSLRTSLKLAKEGTYACMRLSQVKDCRCEHCTFHKSCSVPLSADDLCVCKICGEKGLCSNCEVLLDGTCPECIFERKEEEKNMVLSLQKTVRELKKEVKCLSEQVTRSDEVAKAAQNEASLLEEENGRLSKEHSSLSKKFEKLKNGVQDTNALKAKVKHTEEKVDTLKEELRRSRSYVCDLEASEASLLQKNSLLSTGVEEMMFSLDFASARQEVELGILRRDCMDTETYLLETVTSLC